QICEVFPRMAKMMDKFAVIRSVVGSDGAHDGYQCLSGWTRRNQGTGGYPAIGPVLWKLQGPVDRAVPPAIGLAAPTQHMEWSEPGGPGYLGPKFAPFPPNPVSNQGISSGTSDIRLNGISLERLQDRRQLLQALDGYWRNMES